MSKNIYVIGHRNPDSDSICSSIAYAYLKNKVSNDEYTPARIGEINRETEFILNYFNVEIPISINNLKAQVSDIDITEINTVASDISLKEAWETMKKTKHNTLLISDCNSKLDGIITGSDITWAYMDVTNNNVVADAKTPYKNILKVLDGKIITGNREYTLQKGNVMVAAMNPDVMGKFIGEDDIVIVGNRVDAQLCAVMVGAQCIIVTGDFAVTDEIKKLAEQKACTIITTPYDTYTVARLINQSIPINYAMKSKDILTFSLDENIDDVKEEMLNKKYRNYPVVDEEYRVIGTISRASLLKMNKKKVILVDHNESAQSIKGLDQAEVLEIIDHHRIGDIQTIKPVHFRNQPIGSTATIIAQIYDERNIEIPVYIAGLLCSAILSDTLLFKSPTCTGIDKIKAEKLAKIAGINMEEYAYEMFKAGSRLLDKTDEEIFYQDYKLLQVDGIKIGIGQINSMDKDEISIIKKRLIDFMKILCEKKKLDLVVFMITNIIDDASDVLYYGDRKDIICSAFDADIDKEEVYLKEVVSRKKQVVPPLINAINEINYK